MDFSKRPKSMGGVRDLGGTTRPSLLRSERGAIALGRAPSETREALHKLYFAVSDSTNNCAHGPILLCNSLANTDTVSMRPRGPSGWVLHDVVICAQRPRAAPERAGLARVTAFSASTTVGVRRLSVEAAPELDDLLEDGAEQPGDGVEGDCIGALEVKPVAAPRSSTNSGERSARAKHRRGSRRVSERPSGAHRGRRRVGRGRGGSGDREVGCVGHGGRRVGRGTLELAASSPSASTGAHTSCSLTWPLR